MQEPNIAERGDQVAAAPPPASPPLASPPGEPAPAAPAASTEPIPVPAARPGAEPAAEAPAEPIAETATGPVSEPAAEVSAEPMAGMLAEPPASAEPDVAAEGEPGEPAAAEAEPAGASSLGGEVVERAPDIAEAGPSGSIVAVPPPPPAERPQPRGVWSDEQTEAFRARLREVTATVVDTAAGAVIETVNSIAAAIRARSSGRRGDDRRG